MGFSGNKNADVPDPQGSKCMDFNYGALLAPLFDKLHSAAAAIYGKNFFLDFMLIFEKFRLFYDVGTHF